MACSALILFAAAVAGWATARRRRSAVMKGLTAAALTLLVLLTATAIRVSAASIARSLEIRVAYVDPGFLGYLAPAAFAGFAFIAAWRALEDVWTSPSALRFYVWVLGFTAANVVNWCSPGWCETIGFPFVWRNWSDAIGYDDRFRHVTDAIGGALNLLTFAAVSWALTRRRPPKRTN